MKFTISDDDTYAKNVGEFREMWVEEIDGDPLTTRPSMKDIIDGLYEFQCEFINMNLQKINNGMAIMYKESERKTFDFFLKGLSIPEANKPIKLKAFNDPNSIEVKLILYLYSMEPPFY